MSNIQITVRSITDSPTIEFHVNKHFAKLCKLSEKISKCHVVVDATHRHKLKGKMFRITIDLTMGGRELVCRKENGNLFVAIREGFTAIEKLMKKSVKKKVTLLGRRAGAVLVGDAETAA